jgi:hypothetical protein
MRLYIARRHPNADMSFERDGSRRKKNRRAGAAKNSKGDSQVCVESMLSSFS